MKLKLLFLIVYSLIMASLAFPQGTNITSWQMNTTGHQAQYYNSSYTVITLTDSSDVQEVCYNTDTIYVRANSLGNFIMGPWAGDPFTAGGQDYSYLFPRNPVYPSSVHSTLPNGLCGLWINGVAIYTAGDGKSYKSSTNTNSSNGDGNWNTIAWKAHLSEMDQGGGHPDPNKIYHNHSNPYELYDSTANTVHSPIIGWSFDGFPIYGPFGYSTSTDASSAIKRMDVSYQLRNITDRSSTSPAGPSLSAYALGYYIEDYEYISALGDLDEYNGRYCVTPEYPSGTYAYFLGTNEDGTPTYPNILAKKFYGKNGFISNFGASGGSATKPKSGVSCVSTSSSSPTVTLSIGASSISETSGSTTVTATLSAVSGLDVTVNLSLSGTATVTTDYTLSTSITITAGNTTGSITLASVSDTKDENNETVIADISSVTNGTESGTQQATVTITDDDSAPTVTLSAGTASISETSGSTTVTATLSAASGLDVTVNLSLSGAATVTTDYTLSASITITAGNTTGSITLASVSDATDENDETVIIDISSVTNGTESGAQQETVTIIDNTVSGTYKAVYMEAAIYPNPTMGVFNIDLKESLNQIVIIDDKGMVVKIILNPTYHNSINLEEFSNGLYVMQLISESGISIKKISLQK